MQHTLKADLLGKKPILVKVWESEAYRESGGVYPGHSGQVSSRPKGPSTIHTGLLIAFSAPNLQVI